MTTKTAGSTAVATVLKVSWLPLAIIVLAQLQMGININACLLYTSDAADERSSVDLGGRRIIKKKKIENHTVIVNNKKINSHQIHVDLV